MSSNKVEIVAALDAAEAAYRAVASLPLHTLTPSEQQSLLNRLDDWDKHIVALERRTIGRLITEADPIRFGGSTWADVLSRRLRISRGEAQRRIAGAIYAVAPEPSSQ